jgi:ATP-dependent RNA helicase DeaD
MIRLTLSLGKQDGLRPAEVVGLIAGQGNIPGSSIGKIHIYENRTLVDIPEIYLAQVLKATRQAQIRRQPLDLQVAA